MSTPTSSEAAGEQAAAIVQSGIGRRRLLQATAAVGIVGTQQVLGGRTSAGAAAPGRSRGDLDVLQPGTGRITGDHYLSAHPDEVRWGYVPAIGATPVMQMRSGQTVTIDTVSHEGLLEDQGRDPVAYFGSKGVRRRDVLDDAVSVAAGYDRTTRTC